MANISNVEVIATIIDPNNYETDVATFQVTNADAPFSSGRFKCANGTNTIAVPSNARGCIIDCDSLCDTFKILKGVAGDTGIQIFTDLANVRNSGTFVLIFGVTPP